MVDRRPSPLVVVVLLRLSLVSLAHTHFKRRKETKLIFLMFLDVPPISRDEGASALTVRPGGRCEGRRRCRRRRRRDGCFGRSRAEEEEAREVF